MVYSRMVQLLSKGLPYGSFDRASQRDRVIGYWSDFSTVWLTVLLFFFYGSRSLAFQWRRINQRERQQQLTASLNQWPKCPRFVRKCGILQHSTTTLSCNGAPRDPGIQISRFFGKAASGGGGGKYVHHRYIPRGYEISCWARNVTGIITVRGRSWLSCWIELLFNDT